MNKKEYLITWDFSKWIKEVKLEAEPRTILSILKGGLIPAALLLQRFPKAEFLTFHLSSYDGMKQGEFKEHSHWPKIQHGPVLIVDDVRDSGRTLEYVCGRLDSKFDSEILVLVDKAPILKRPVISMVQVPQDHWVVFPWE